MLSWSRCSLTLVGIDDRMCAGFSDAGVIGDPRAETAGVGEAPRHEIAGRFGVWVQRAMAI